MPRSKTLVFQHVLTFPPMGVRVYVYAHFVQLTHMYTLLGQGELAYTSLTTLFLQSMEFDL